MGRLTERDEYGNADIIGVDSGDLQLSLEFMEFNLVTGALNRLAEYEDTGLTPEEIQNSVRVHREMWEEKYFALRDDRDYWKAEALKHCAKLGEIKLLVGRSNE